MEHYWLNKQETYNLMQTRETGLTSAEAEDRLRHFGANKLAEAKKKSLLARVWEQIKDPMILILLAAAIASGVFKEVADMIIILVVVILNTVLGIFQENKAEQAIEALQKMSAPTTKVLREGQVLAISTEQLVPGDLVLLEAGDMVPADLRLIESHSLQIEEAALTGESVPVSKNSEAALQEGAEVPLGDRVNMAYMSTSVAYGRGMGIVVGTGMNTQMGNIALLLADTTRDKTPLQLKLASLSRVLSIAVIAICVFIFFFNVWNGGGFGHTETIFEAFLTAVSLAVAAIPEGLVVVVTVLLSIGVTKMSSRHAIIRKLTAVETLGCTQIICSDKTGTLTQNKMTVVEHYGDTPLLALAMGLCNDSQQNAEGVWLGDPTETALVEFAVGNGLAEQLAQTARLAEAPFDSERKMMSTIHQNGAGFRQFTKGAPDEVLAHCTSIYVDGQVQPLSEQLRSQILAQNDSMADQALRVLAAAFRDYTALPGDEDPAHLEQQLTLIGLTGMIDPVRPEVVAAVGECKQAGIKAIMITGDHKTTAIAIARELGILTDDSQAISGAELAQMSDEQFAARVDDIVVYARVQPEHKVRIVDMWQSKGKITAMTGDGVNDAPALKSADIGVGMGITGTDVTKNVADMVLADDNFATIVYAVEEGRRIYDNIKKAIQFLLASNLSEVVGIFVASLMGMRLFSPIHILWINLITDTFPAMALGMEKAESDIMKQPPRNPKESLFAGGLGIGVIWQGVTIAALTLTSFLIGSATNSLTGMTMAFLTLSMCEIFHAWNMRSRTKSIFSIRHHNKYLLGAILLAFVLTIGVIYLPGVNTVFKLTALPFNQFAIAFGIAFAIVPIVELVKLIKRKSEARGRK